MRVRAVTGQLHRDAAMRRPYLGWIEGGGVAIADVVLAIAHGANSRIALVPAEKIHATIDAPKKGARGVGAVGRKLDHAVITPAQLYRIELERVA